MRAVINHPTNASPTDFEANEAAEQIVRIGTFGA